VYLKQADLFWGLSQGFIQTVTAIASKQEFGQGDTIFRAGEPAGYFFILISGKVQCHLDPTGKRVYASNRIGEIFGWSALIGQEKYSASIICEQPAVVLMLEKERINRLLAEDTESASIFYRQLAYTLGQRLLQMYQLYG
jgi:CRP-like cAMP-binding protein